jgi:hypothetical protein
MIDFSQYSEVAPFITPDLTTNYMKHIDNDYRELPFNDKRLLYINYLDRAVNEYLKYLERGAAGYAAQNDTNIRNQYASVYNDTQTLIEKLEPKPSQYFSKAQPEDQSATCLGTDRVYDMYRNFIGISSRAQGLFMYEEYYVVVLKDVFNVAHQIFNAIGTRGQFFGYLDQQVKGICDLINLNADSLKNVSDDWTKILNTASSQLNDFLNNYDNFINNILIAGNDMRSIIKPIISFLNMLDIGGETFTATWGSVAFNEKIADIALEYGKSSAMFNGDHFVTNQGNSYQITDQMLQHMNDDRSNLEFIMTKATKIALEDADIRNILVQIHNDIIVPNYN